VYCKECERVMDGEGPSAQTDHPHVPPTAAPSGSKPRSRPRITLLLALLLLCAAVVFFLNKGGDEAPMTPTVAEEHAETDIVLQADEGAQTNATEPRTLDAPLWPGQSVLTTAEPPAPEQVADTVAEPETDLRPRGFEIIEFNATSQEASYPEDPTLAGNQTALAAKPEVQGVEQPQDDEATLLPDDQTNDDTPPVPDADALTEGADATAESDANATAEAEATPEVEQPEIIDGIWIYHLSQRGRDRELAEHLQSKGYGNVTSKGRWPGHFNDKNVFYRNEDEHGLDRLKESLPSDDYYHYFYDNERIGTSVKSIFQNNEDVNFLIVTK
jgi:hypothetical protein